MTFGTSTDPLTTQEILTGFAGCGLDGLSASSTNLNRVVNWIVTDPRLPRYDAATFNLWNGTSETFENKPGSYNLITGKKAGKRLTAIAGNGPGGLYNNIGVTIFDHLAFSASFVPAAAGFTSAFGYANFEKMERAYCAHASGLGNGRLTTSATYVALYGTDNAKETGLMSSTVALGSKNFIYKSSTSRAYALGDGNATSRGTVNRSLFFGDGLADAANSNISTTVMDIDNVMAVGFDSIRRITGTGPRYLSSFGNDNMSQTVISGILNHAFGRGNFSQLTSGTGNIVFSDSGGSGTSTANFTTAAGFGATANNYSNSSAFGNQASASGPNRVQLGNSSATPEAANGLATPSDRNLKDDIAALDPIYGSELLSAIDIVSFLRKPNNAPVGKRRHWGLIAQDLAQVIADLQAKYPDKHIDVPGLQDLSAKNGAYPDLWINEIGKLRRAEKRPDGISDDVWVDYEKRYKVVPKTIGKWQIADTEQHPERAEQSFRFIYECLIPPLVLGFQQQSARIDDLEARMAKLEKALT